MDAGELLRFGRRIPVSLIGLMVLGVACAPPLLSEPGDRSCQVDSDCRLDTNCLGCNSCYSVSPVAVLHYDCEAVCRPNPNLACLCRQGQCGAIETLWIQRTISMGRSCFNDDEVWSSPGDPPGVAPCGDTECLRRLLDRNGINPLRHRHHDQPTCTACHCPLSVSMEYFLIDKHQLQLAKHLGFVEAEKDFPKSGEERAQGSRNPGIGVPLCVRAGCSNQLCVPAGQSQVTTTCEWRREYACLRLMRCEAVEARPDEIQPAGGCRWQETPESKACQHPVSAPL